MSDIIGYDITPNSGSSLRKILKLSLEAYMDKMEEVSMAATKEHALEMELKEMKTHWNNIEFETANYRDSSVKILGSVELIESYLEDHLVKTQTMRGSPYFKPFEKEVLGWESQLIRNLQNESQMFKDVDQIWKKTMDTIAKDPRVLTTAGTEGMLEEIKHGLHITITIDDGINKYVEDKKLIFPRFFFMSNTDILGVLTETKDPTKVIPYCQKIFEGINRLEMNEICSIEAMISPTNERVELVEPIQPRDSKGCVEKWLTELEEQMFGTLQQLIASAKETMPNAKQTTWIQDWPSQVILVVQHLLWTLDIQEAIKGGEQALKEQYLKLSNEVDAMIHYLKDTPLTESVFILVKSLIIQQLHFKEVTENVYRDKIITENDFSWSTQLKMSMKDSQLQLSMFNVDIPYRYEYVGSIKRLVMTPTTHQGILGLMLTFKQNYYSGIQGPCNVGKSSLAQELAAYIGTMYRVMTGSDRNTVDSVINYICGIVSSGCWGIIEDFDRASSGVMSYLSVLVDNLRQCAQQDAENLTLDTGKSIPIEKGFFLMKTSHIAYVGRNKVPESLKILFRPLTIVAPCTKLIIKNILISFGFKDFENISKEIDCFVNLFNSQFSKWTNYHFGLRRIEVILELARNYSKADASQHEMISLKQAIRDEIYPSLKVSDLKVVERIIRSVFGKDNSDTNTNKQEDCVENCLNQLNIHQSVIIFGPTFSGKTTILKAVAEKRNVEKKYIINPKSMSTNELFGKNTAQGWQSGMLSLTFKKFQNCEGENWVIFDGPLDHNWVENFNSLLDFKQLFYFDSGETFNISNQTKIIFESSNLDNLTPATISRCGIVSVSDACLNWSSIFDRWFENIRQAPWIEGHDVLLKDLFEWIIPPLLKMLKTCKTSVQVTVNSLVQCSFDLFQRILVDALPNLKERKYLRGWIQAAVVYGAIWSIGGCLKDDSERVKFDNGVREVIFGKSQAYPLPPSLNGKFDALPPVEGIIFDFVFDFKARGQWKHWNDVIKNIEIPDVYDVFNLLVPTVDSSRYSHILELNLKMKKPFMLIGPRGSGKSIYISNTLHKDLDSSVYEHNVLNFTPETSSKNVFSKFMSCLVKKKQQNFGTKSNKNLIMFLDNFELPLPDDFGDQAPNEFIHLFLDHKVMFDFDKYEECILNDTNIVCAMNSNPGMNQKISSRTIRHFHAISCSYPTDDSIQKVFSTKLNIFFKTRCFQPEASGIVGPLVQSTIFLHNQLRKNMFQVKSKPHYIFNIRDVEKVITGCMMLPKELSDNKKLFTRLWVHESLRTFNDKLTTSEDTGFLFEKLKHCVKVIFRENFDSAFEHLGKVDGFVTEFNLRNLTFGDFVKVEEKLFYQEITSFEAFSKQANQSLSSFFDAFPNKTFDFKLLKYSMEGISKICRILSQENGSMILLGEPGTGRELITRVASIIKDTNFYTPPITQDFTVVNWRNDFKRLLKDAGGLGKGCVLFLSPEMVDNNAYIEDVNNFLTNYELPGLFSVEEMYEITAQVHNFLKKTKETEAELSPTELYEKFKERCRANFHVILKVSMQSNVFTSICRKYPKILDSSTVCLFQQWPKDALKKSSELFFEELPISRDERNALISCMIEIYEEVLLMKTEINDSTSHVVEITPSSFIACIKYFTELFQLKLTHYNTQKKMFDDILLKFEWISNEIGNLEKDIADIHNQADDLDSEYLDFESKLKQEETALSNLEQELNLEEKKVEDEEKVLDGVRQVVDAEFKEINEKIDECLKILKSFSAIEITQPCQLKKPNTTLKKTMAAICLLLGVEPDMIPDPSSKKKDAELVPDYWGPSKRLLQTTDFIDRLENLNKEDVLEDCLNTLRTDYVNSDLEPTALTKSTPVGEAICRWLKNVEIYITIDKANQEKKDDLKNAELKFDDVKKQCFNKNMEVENQQEYIKDISSQMQENKEKRKELLEESCFMTTKKGRGEELLTILEEECVWWQDQKGEQENYLQALLGNIVIISTAMFYTAAFPGIYRTKSKVMIERLLEKWSIKFSEVEFRLSMFVKQNDIIQWELLGMPNVRYYVMNALFIKISPRWPFLIDPTNQTTKWIKLWKSKQSIISVEVSDDELVKKVIKAVEEGFLLIVENIVDKLDSHLFPLIKREFFYTDKVKMVDIGGKHIPVHSNFQIIFSSSLEKIKFPSFFQTNFLLINCLSTEEGTIDSLRRMVMAKERQDIGQKTEYYIKRYCDTAASLETNRNNIIKILLNTDGNILDHENVCNEIRNYLANIKTCLSKNIKLESMEQEIKTIIDSYLPIARHAMAIFQTVRKLESLNPLYKYSFDWYCSLFMSSIENSNKSKVLSKRVRYLCDHLTYNCFVQVSQSLFLQERQLFSFMLCLDLMLFRKIITETEIKVLLCDAPKTCEKNPSSSWLSDKRWDQICNLEQIDCFEGITEDFKVKSNKWKIINDSVEPDDLPFHLPWNTRLTKLHKLMIIKILRPDKLLEIFEAFIGENLGYKFVETVNSDLGRILADSGPKTPVFLLLSENRDPIEIIRKLRVGRHGSKSSGFKIFSLLSNQMKLICSTIEASIRDGSWILVQNCQYCLDAKNNIQKIYSIIQNTADINEDFRLWFTSEPVSFLGSKVPGNSIKFVIEPQKYVKEQILEVLQNSFISREVFETGVAGKEASFSKVLYSLIFLFIKCVGRNAFETGWSVKTLFNIVDMEFAMNSLRDVLQLFEGVNFLAIKYLINHCNMKHRILDTQDQLLLEALLEDILKEEVLTVNRFKLSDSPDIYVPNKVVYNDVLEAVKIIPQKSSYEVFNLRKVSQTKLELTEADELTKSLKVMYKLIPGKGVTDPVRHLERMAKYNQTLESLPEYDWIIKEELQNYCQLISYIAGQLNDLKMQLNGYHLIGPSNENLLKSLEHNLVPTDWIKMADIGLNDTTSFIDKIEVNMNILESVDYVTGLDLSAWLDPLRLIEGAKLEFCQKADVSFSKLDTQVSILKCPPETTNDHSKILLKDLFLVYAQFNYEDNVLEHCEEDTYQHIPYLQLKFYDRTEVEVDPFDENYLCPLYLTSSRTTSNGNSSHISYFRIATSVSASELTKAGAALVVHM